MSDSAERSSRKYAKISIKRRNQLIELVMQKGKAIAQAAKRLNIKLSTAKHIVKTYVQSGYLYNKKMNRNEANNSGCSKEISKSEQKSEENLHKPQQKDVVKVQVKSECLSQIQISKPVVVENAQEIYPLSRFAGIPHFYFYSPYQSTF